MKNYQKINNIRTSYKYKSTNYLSLNSTRISKNVKKDKSNLWNVMMPLTLEG